MKQIENSLSKSYLLYLRDMSRKVSFSRSDYSQVLLKTTRKKTDNENKFPRITTLNLQKLVESNSKHYRLLQLEKEKNDDGIFCGVGILAGTYKKKVKAGSRLSLIAAPVIYGQVTLEESDPAELSEWVINYDMVTALIEPNPDESQEALNSIQNPDSGKSGYQVVQRIEDELDKVKISIDDLARVSALSEEFVSRFGELTETPCEHMESPLQCIEAAISARDDLKRERFFFCPGDWIFFAPIPPNLSTYRALDDLARGEIAS